MQFTNNRLRFARTRGFSFVPSSFCTHPPLRNKLSRELTIIFSVKSKKELNRILTFARTPRRTPLHFWIIKIGAPHFYPSPPLKQCLLVVYERMVPEHDRKGTPDMCGVITVSCWSTFHQVNKQSVVRINDSLKARDEDRKQRS